MEFSHLLIKLKSLNVELSTEGNRLRVTAPVGAISADIADAIRQYKPDLLAILGELSNRPTPSVKVERVEDRTSYPLSPSQERNLYAAQNGPGLATAFIIRGPLDPERLQSVLDHIVSRHASLRTTIETDGNEFKAKVVSQETSQMALMDFSAEDLEAKESGWRESELSRRLMVEASRPFSLDNGPLYRFRLCRVQDKLHVLALFFSQLVFDGTSFDLFLKELTEGYAALTKGTPLPEAPLAIEYMDYVAWKRRLLTERGSEMAAWWKKTLGQTVPDSPIPLDYPRPLVPAYKGLLVPMMISADFADLIRKLAKELGVTTQLVLLSAAFILVNRLSGRSDCHIAIPIDGRGYPEFEPIIGSFANLVLLRVELNQETPYKAFLPELRDYCMTAFDNQEIPIESLGLRVERKGTNSRSPLFQLEFSYRHVSQQNTMMGPVSLSQVEIHGGGTPNELCLWIEDLGHKIAGEFEFATALFERKTIDHWMKCYLGILRFVVTHPDAVLGEIDILAEEKLLVESVLKDSLNSLPDHETLLEGHQLQNLCLLDQRGRSVPLGVWGNLVSDSRILVENIRLRANGTWEIGTKSEIPGKKNWNSGVGLQPDANALVAPVEDEKSATGKPPTTLLQEQILAVWREVLGREVIGVDENFFDLGGHSLLAVSLIRKLNALFDGNGTDSVLTLADIFENQTVEGMATRIGTNEPRLRNPVLSLNNAKTGTLVYFVVGIHLYHELARRLHDTARCYGVFLPAEEALLVSGVKLNQWKVSDLAAAYREVILAHSQGEPLSLIGVSFGGVVAYELARQLQENGGQVSLLVMLDSLLPSGMHRNHLKWFVSQIEKIVKLGPGETINKLKSKLVPVRRKAELNNHEVSVHDYKLPDQRLVVYADALDRFEMEEAESTYNGKTLLVHANDGNSFPGLTIKQHYGWEKHITGEFLIDSAPGDHLGILKPPHVDVTADIIKRAISGILIQRKE